MELIRRRRTILAAERVYTSYLWQSGESLPSWLNLYAVSDGVATISDAGIYLYAPSAIWNQCGVSFAPPMTIDDLLYTVEIEYADLTFRGSTANNQSINFSTGSKSNYRTRIALHPSKVFTQKNASVNINITSEWGATTSDCTVMIEKEANNHFSYYKDGSKKYTNDSPITSGSGFNEADGNLVWLQTGNSSTQRPSVYIKSISIRW